MTTWISTSDPRRPKDIQHCWIYDTETNLVQDCHYYEQWGDEECWVFECATYPWDRVSHWMPVEKPEPPKDA